MDVIGHQRDKQDGRRNVAVQIINKWRIISIIYKVPRYLAKPTVNAYPISNSLSMWGLILPLFPRGPIRRNQSFTGRVGSKTWKPQN